jgi:hypothetical protein
MCKHNETLKTKENTKHKKAAKHIVLYQKHTNAKTKKREGIMS